VSIAAPAPSRTRRREAAPRPQRSQRPRVAARPRRRAGLTRGGLIWLLLLTTLLGGIVALNVAALRTSITVSRLNVQAQQLGQGNRDLNAEVARLSAPGRVNRIAARYHMVQPTIAPHDYLHLRPHRHHHGGSRTAP
jgi:cell division protein FtsL